MDLKTLGKEEIMELVQKEGQAVRTVEYLPRWDRKQARYVLSRQAIHATGQALGGVGPDITNVTASNILFEVLGLVGPEYALRNACRIANTPNLIGTVRVATKASANSDIGAGEEPDLKNITYAQVPINLRDHKDVYPALFLDEDKKQANTDLMSDAAKGAAIGLAVSENTKIKTLIEAATAQVGGDWASTNSYEDINSARSVIYAATGYVADVMAAGPYVWSDFFGSTNVKAAVAAGGRYEYPGVLVFPVPGAPGLTGIMDYSMTTTIALIIAQDAAFVHADGPTEAEQFRLPMRGADVYLIRHWNQPYQAISTAAIRLTGVHV
jgi:hypothetical protein